MVRWRVGGGRCCVLWSFCPWSEISPGQEALYIHTESCGLFCQLEHVLAALFWLKTHNGYNHSVENKVNIQMFQQLHVCIGDLSASDTSLVDLVERHRGPLPPELMPLPSSDRDSPLEWTHLVDVANTFESERNTHYGTANYSVSPFMWLIFMMEFYMS